MQAEMFMGDDGWWLSFWQATKCMIIIIIIIIIIITVVIEIMIKNASTIHAHRHLSRIKSTHTNLSLPPCALLDHCPRHGAADGKTLENSSDGVTQTKGDQLLHQKKHTFYLQTIILTNSLLLAFNWNQVFSCVKLYLFIYWLMYLLCVFLCSFVFLLFYSAYVTSSFIVFLPLFV